MFLKPELFQCCFCQFLSSCS